MCAEWISSASRRSDALRQVATARLMLLRLRHPILIEAIIVDDRPGLYKPHQSLLVHVTRPGAYRLQAVFTGPNGSHEVSNEELFVVEHN